MKKVTSNILLNKRKTYEKIFKCKSGQSSGSLSFTWVNIQVNSEDSDVWAHLSLHCSYNVKEKWHIRGMSINF